MPTSASTGVKELGFKSCTHTALPSIPLRLRSHAVTVVPTFAPIMTFMACFRVMSPEFTKPTTITVVAEELCMTAVMPIPVRKPVMTLPVILPRSVLSLFPALRSSACPIRFIPNRNRHRPPIIVRKSNISICLSYIRYPLLL